MAGILDSNFKEMVSRDQRLGRVFTKVPRPAFRRGKTIKELLCRARLPPVRKIATRGTAEEARHGLSRCNKGLARRGCVGCPFMTSRPNEVVKYVTIHNTGQKIPVEGRPRVDSCTYCGPKRPLPCSTWAALNRSLFDAWGAIRGTLRTGG